MTALRARAVVTIVGASFVIMSVLAVVAAISSQNDDRNPKATNALTESHPRSVSKLADGRPRSANVQRARITPTAGPTVKPRTAYRARILSKPRGAVARAPQAIHARPAAALTAHHAPRVRNIPHPRNVPHPSANTGPIRARKAATIASRAAISDTRTAPTAASAQACTRALHHERMAAPPLWKFSPKANFDRKAALAASGRGLAANEHCGEPFHRLVNEAFLLSDRAAAEHDLNIPWQADLARSMDLLAQCAHARPTPTSMSAATLAKVSADCRKQQLFDRRFQQQVTPRRAR